MLRKRKLVQLQRVVVSNKFYFIVTIIVFLACTAIIFSSHFEKHFINKYHAKRISIYRITWTGRRHENNLLDCNEGLSQQNRSFLRKKEANLLKLQTIKHKNYIQNYTRCLTIKANNISGNFDKFHRSKPESFDEIVRQLHEKCRIQVFGSKENKCQRNELVGNMAVRKDLLTMKELKQRELDFVTIGGKWNPTDCIAKSKVAVIIPLRDRSEHLFMLLRQLHVILKRQNLLYQIFVIEQDDEYPFNRGKLMNTGFKEALKIFDFNCFVFHDVDLIPENDQNDYGCPNSPRHMSVAVDKFNYKLPYQGLFGGVESFSENHFRLVNGFSNSYWGWGAEDDDMYKRIVKSKLVLHRPSVDHGRYTMIKHKQSERPPDRLDKLQVAENSFSNNGLVALLYQVKKRQENLLYTLIRVDLRMEDDMLF